MLNGWEVHNNSLSPSETLYKDEKYARKVISHRIEASNIFFESLHRHSPPIPSCPLLTRCVNKTWVVALNYMNLWNRGWFILQWRSAPDGSRISTQDKVIEATIGMADGGQDGKLIKKIPWVGGSRDTKFIVRGLEVAQETRPPKNFPSKKCWQPCPFFHPSLKLSTWGVLAMV
jgi:hypothetical protein